MSKHIYGCKPDKKDERDFRLAKPTVATLPPSVDLRNLASPVYDQGDLGSCTGWGITSLREFLENKSPLKLFFKLIKKKFVHLSPLWLYYNERVLEGTVSEDDGAEIRDGLKVLAKQGCATNTSWPYIISKFTKKPTKAADKTAPAYKITTYTRLNDLNDLKTCMANGNAVVLGISVYDSFESDEVASTGIVPMPKSSEQLLGGHCIYGGAYFDDTSFSGGGYVFCKNSWGTSWGLNGWFKLPYSYFTPDLVSDMWMIS